MKKNRLDKIIDIITTCEVETQDELITYLKDAGYAVTQATVSRDIRELKLAKVMTGRGNYRYVLPKEDRIPAASTSAMPWPRPSFAWRPLRT